MTVSVSTASILGSGDTIQLVINNTIDDVRTIKLHNLKTNPNTNLAFIFHDDILRLPEYSDNQTEVIKSELSLLQLDHSDDSYVRDYHSMLITNRHHINGYKMENEQFEDQIYESNIQRNFEYKHFDTEMVVTSSAHGLSSWLQSAFTGILHIFSIFQSTEQKDKIYLEDKDVDLKIEYYVEQDYNIF